MKQLLLAIFLLFISTIGFSQTYPDSSDNVYLDISKKKLVQISSLPIGAVVDSVIFYSIAGKFYAIEDWGSGVISTRNAGLVANGANGTYILNKLINSPYVHTIVLDDITKGTITLNNINFKHKPVIFTGGVRLRASSAINVDSLNIVNFNPSDFILDTLLNLTNLKVSQGYLTPMNVGAIGDGVGNDVRYLFNSIKTTAQNNLYLNCYGMRFYAASPITLSPKASIKGGTFTLLRGARFTQNFTRMDSLSFLDMKVIMTGAIGLASAYIFDLRSNVSDKSYGLSMENIDIRANRVNYFGVRLGNQVGATLDKVDIYRSFSTSIMIDSSESVLVQNCHLDSIGRAGVSVHSHNKGIKVINNFLTGSQQSENFGDGVLDVYGSFNDGVIFANNTMYITNFRVNATVDQRFIRVKGSKNVKVFGNQGYSYSTYLNCFVDVSYRDITNSREVEIYNNTFQAVSGVFSTGAYFYGNTGGLQFYENTLIVDSAVTVTGTGRFFQTSYQNNTDTILFANFTKNFLHFNGKNIVTLQNYTRLMHVDFSGTNVLNSPNIFSSNSENWIRSLTWIGGLINTSSNNPYFFITPTYQSVITVGITINRPNTRWFVRSSNDTARIVSANNVVNGDRAYADGGGLFGFSATSAATTFTMGDSLSVFIGNRTAEQLLTIPAKQGYIGNMRYVSQINTGYIIVNGVDTIRQGKGALYYQNTNSSYIKILDNFNTSSGGPSGPTTLTGDVTGSGTGTFATTIANNAVTTGKTADNAITFAKFQQMVNTSVLGRAANSAGNAAAIQATLDGQVLRRSAGVLGFGNIPYASIDDVPEQIISNTDTIPGSSLFFLQNDTLFAKKLIAGDGVTFTVTPKAIKVNSLGIGGDYTPAGGGITNVSAVIVGSGACRYSRDNNVVTVSGYIGITPSATAGAVEFWLNLPIASDFINGSQANGTVTAYNGDGGSISSDWTNNRLTFYLPTSVVSGATQFVRFMAQYTIY